MKNEDVENYVKAGEIAKEVKAFARDFIKPGMKLIDIAKAIDEKIFELGGEPAFPVNLCLNEIAAHFTPTVGDETVAEELLKIDMGIAVEGFIADTAFSMDLTEDGEFGEMIELNKKILENVTSVIKPGMEVRDIGEAAQDTLEKWNSENGSTFSIIKSLSGHVLAHETVHAGLTISNYKNENTKKLDDTAFAVEPFVTTGVGDIYEGEPGGIYVLQSEGQVRDRDARNLLNYIKDTFGTLPFCSRWLQGEEFKKVRFSLSLLTKQEILHHYPMLIEKSKKPVTQFENTFVISEDEVIRTTE